MSLTGGKRKVNKSLKAWVAFVKKVQKEEKLSYKDAIHRAKVRKDKGEKWMSGGNTSSMSTSSMMSTPMSGGAEIEDETIEEIGPDGVEEVEEEEVETMAGGRRRTRRMMRGKSRSRGRTARRARRRASRRH